MTQNIVQVALLSGLIALSVGCNKSGDTAAAAQNDATAKGNPAIQNATYQSTCAAAAIGPVKFAGMQTFFELSNLNYTKHMVYYSDDCKTVVADVRETGTLHVVGDTASVPNALDVDFTYGQTLVMVSNQAILDGFNLANICGQQWTLNTETDVSTKADGAMCPGKAAPRKTADIILVENNTLFLGADAEQDASQPRVTQVDRTKPYTLK